MKESEKAAARKRKLIERERNLIERGRATRAQCGECGHPGKEHRGQDLCTVPKCQCTGYFLMELSSN